MENSSRKWMIRGSRLLVLAAAALVVPACGGGRGAGAPVGNVISLKGGNATAGSGQYGGYFEVEAYNGSDVGVLSGGVVNASIGEPALVQPFLGSNPLIVTADATLAVGSGPSGSSLSNANSTVANVAGTVTGLWVKPGVTLTIKPNAGPTGAAAHTLVSLNFSEAIYVQGAIKMAARDGVAEGDSLGADTANFYVSFCTSFITTPGSVIDLAGANNLAGAGGNGGYFNCYNGDFVQSYALIKTNGGDGSTSGGFGGEVDLESDWGPCFNHGDIRTYGGTGAAGVGGGAGNVYLYANDYAYLYNTGNVYAFGGNGTTGGGDGNFAYWYTSEGHLVNSGSIFTYGGNATVSGNAGHGGYIYLNSDGQVRHSGTLDTHGGVATAGDGGYGGYVYVYSYGAYSYAGDYVPNGGGIWFAGNVTTDGGNGTTGAGYAGDFYMYADYSGYASAGPNMQPVYLIGYSTINNSGGDGSVNGGNAGGSNNLNSWYTYDDVSVYYGGSVINQANVISRGGNGTTGFGGAGPYWELQTEDEIYLPYNYGITNSGSFDLSGGNGGTAGGAAGYMYWWADFFLHNSGAIVANGGDGGTGNGGNGSTSDIEIYCRTTLTNASVTSNGGNSDSANGGVGGNIYIYGTVATGGSRAKGGNSTSATGGNGGYIELFSDQAPSTFGAFDVSAGTGATGTPTIGDVWVDGRHLVGP
jgi:hypothetical protein